MNARHLKLMGDYGQIVHLPYQMTDEKSVLKAVSHSNVVINLIGSQFETRNYNFHDSNVKCSYRVAKCAKEAGVKRFIQLSAVGADINSPSKWLKTKAEGENVVREFFPDATILRPCTIYGFQDRFLNTFADLCNFFPIVPLIDEGKQRVQPVYVVDVANAVLACIEQDDTLGKIYELGGERVMTMAQVVELILHEIVRPSNTMNLSPTMARLYATVLEKLPKQYSVLNRDMVEQMLSDKIVEKRKGIYTFEDLGITPQTFRSTVPNVLIRHRGNRVPADTPPRSPLTDE